MHPGRIAIEHRSDRIPHESDFQRMDGVVISPVLARHDADEQQQESHSQKSCEAEQFRPFPQEIRLTEYEIEATRCAAWPAAPTGIGFRASPDLRPAATS
jgi:hypothetical protein